MLQLAQNTDRASVNRLARQVHEMHVQWRPDIYQMPQELYSEERFLDAIKARELYVASVDSFVIGYASLRIRETGTPGLVTRKVMLIDELCVDESFRRQRLGTQMMMDIRALARAFGCSDIQLSVYPQNDEAVAFYQKMGFTIHNITMQTKL